MRGPDPIAPNEQENLFVFCCLACQPIYDSIIRWWDTSDRVASKFQTPCAICAMLKNILVTTCVTSATARST